MIVDCFTFYNELDLLELRLRTLEGVVDRFVLCEAPFTFRGQPKPLFFAEHAARFARWSDRIDHVVYAHAPAANPWENEWGQRDFLATALTNVPADTLILLGDVDEIPDPLNVSYRPHSAGGIVVHQMVMSLGYVNLVSSGGEPVWPGTRSFFPAAIARYGSLSNVRKERWTVEAQVRGGWHFTSLGGAEAMERKMGAYSHVEFDVPYYRDRYRLDHEYHDESLTYVPLDERFPAAIRTDERWRRYVLSEPQPSQPAPKAALCHAHGCYAYVPPGARVAAFAGDVAWSAAGTERFGDRFAGLIADDGGLPKIETGTWVVVDGFERLGPRAVRALADAGIPLVAYATNARSQHVFERVLMGEGTFPPAPARGRLEHTAALAQAGYRIDRVDRIFSKYRHHEWFPPATGIVRGIMTGSFVFTEVEHGAFEDFSAVAFVYILSPP